MEFRRNQEEGIGMPVSLGFSPPPVRPSAFAKPSSSLLSPRGGGGGGATSTGIGLASTIAPDAFDPTTTRTPTTLGINPDATPISISSPVSATVGGGGGLYSRATPTATSSPPVATKTSYRECLRNHAASLGGHVLDGCGEFMPGGDAGTPDPLKCAACGCHRSFHRKESEGEYCRFNNGSPHHGAGLGRIPLLPPPPSLHPHPHHHLQTSSPSGPVPVAVAFGGNYSGNGGATTESSSEDHAGAPPLATPPGAASRKRFRTKFTAEQKEKMLAFAERSEWRIQKQDETVVEQFCVEVGVKKQVLKVWMHNNKHTLRKQQQHPPPQEEPTVILKRE